MLALHRVCGGGGGGESWAHVKLTPPRESWRVVEFLVVPSWEL